MTTSWPSNAEILKAGFALRFADPTEDLLNLTLARESRTVAVAVHQPANRLLFLQILDAPLRRTMGGPEPQAAAFLKKLRDLVSEITTVSEPVQASTFQLSAEGSPQLASALTTLDTLHVIEGFSTHSRGTEHYLTCFHESLVPRMWVHQVAVQAAHHQCLIGIAFLHHNPTTNMIERVLCEYHPVNGSMMETATSSSRFFAERGAMHKVATTGMKPIVGSQWWIDMIAPSPCCVKAMDKVTAALAPLQDHIQHIEHVEKTPRTVLIMRPNSNHKTAMKAVATLVASLSYTCQYPVSDDTTVLPMEPLVVREPPTSTPLAPSDQRKCTNPKCKCLMCECTNCGCDDLNSATEIVEVPKAPTTKITVGGHFQLVVLGMSCASCAVRIENSLRATPGVLSAVVNFATASASITSTAEIDDPQTFIDLLDTMGYTSKVQESGSSDARDALAKTQEIADLQYRVLISVLFGIPLFVLMILRLQLEHKMEAVMMPFYQQVSWDMFIDWALATPILIIGRHFFIRAFKSLLHCAYTMDTLVAFGVGGAYLFSVVIVILSFAGVRKLMTYFEAAGLLLAFMLVGKYLEARAKKETGAAIVKLMDLAPRTAILVTTMGEVEVPSSSINVGDVVRVVPGAHIPVDGTVTKGQSAVDEQLITGESVPAEKTVGDSVIGGTLCTNSDLLVRADRVGEDTALFRILKIVREAQNSKPAIQRIADKIAGVFVPLVIIYSFIVLVVWLILGYSGAYPESWRGDHSPLIFAFTFFLASLVVACPCALGLATPTAIMVGTGMGAMHGILIKSGQTLEHAKRVDCVLFDKTGTLTKGKLEVVSTRFFSGQKPDAYDKEEALRLLIGTIESRSMHPVAKAITLAFGVLPESQVQDLTVENLPGSGLSAKLINQGGSETTVFVGSPAHLAKKGWRVSTEIQAMVLEAQKSGTTVILATINGDVRALVALADTPKEDARAVVLELHRRNIEVRMVSGDNIHAAQHIAALVGIPSTHVHAEVLPCNKAEVVGLHQGNGRIVCFVGDGLNDSPALSQADVGVALGAGTEVAIESADAVLVRNALVDLIGLLSLSKATVRRIYFNFFLAMVYNMCALPLASGIFFPAWNQQIPPIIAGAAMVSSSLSVLSSSLLLRCHRPPTIEELQALAAEDTTMPY